MAGEGDFLHATFADYLEDDDLAFLPECSEAHLEAFTRILTHGENGKPRLSSTLLRNETFLAMEGHPERYRRNWQLIAGELQHFGGDSIANTLRRHGKFMRVKASRCASLHSGRKARSSSSR